MSKPNKFRFGKSKNSNRNNDGDNVLNTPCSVAEALQIARAAAEDVLTEHLSHVSHVQVAMSLQIEILKDIVISAGLITEDEFKAKYIEQAETFNKMQQEMIESTEEETEGDSPTASTKMDVNVGDVEIKKG